MNTYIWRHNRRMHSWSMMNEPNINQALYTDAVLVVQAETEDAAYALIEQQGNNWIIEDLKRLKPRVISKNKAAVIFSDIRGE